MNSSELPSMIKIYQVAHFKGLEIMKKSFYFVVLYFLKILNVCGVLILSTSCQNKSNKSDTLQNNAFNFIHSENSKPSTLTLQKSTTNITAMDTFMTIQIYGDKKITDIANQKAKEEILRIEKLLSVTDSESEIFMLNHHQNEWLDVNQTTWEILLESKKMAQLTKGAFNPCLYPVLSAWGFTTGSFSVPDNQTIQNLMQFTDFEKMDFEDSCRVFLPENMMIDLGGIAKGFTGDKIIQILKKNGIESALLDFGGNIQTLGTKPDGSKWNIGIKNPLTGEVAAGIKVENLAVITSGGYERFFTTSDGKKYIHIIDSKTGFPVDNEIASVTIVAESGTYADALSTALFVMGTEQAFSFWKKCKSEHQNTHQNFEMLIFTKNKQTFVTKGLENKVDFIDGDFEICWWE